MPGCGSWDSIASRSMARIFSRAAASSSGGSERQWSRMSTDLSIPSACLINLENSFSRVSMKDFNNAD